LVVGAENPASSSVFLVSKKIIQNDFDGTSGTPSNQLSNGKKRILPFKFDA